MDGIDILLHPIHLGLGAKAEVEPAFTGEMAWYETYAQRHGADGIEGRLVTMHTFAKPWEMWEMHPDGSEVVLCVAGELTLHQQGANGGSLIVSLSPGQYAINQAGVWHTADAQGLVTVLFITAGRGTQHRPR